VILFSRVTDLFVLNLEPWSSAYATELKSLFQNLVSNSIKFRKPGITPVLHIEAFQTNGYWQFSVHDNGIASKSSTRKGSLLFFNAYTTGQPTKVRA
jgi:light-regulated signal transduction histidine kinase (bacteriophytochrome)